jgi:hypothetical protein
MVGIFRAELDERTLQGPAVVTWRIGPARTVSRGRARFVEGDPPTLVFDYHGGQAFVPRLGTLPLPSGEIEDFPLEVGRCEVVEVEG